MQFNLAHWLPRAYSLYALIFKMFRRVFGIVQLSIEANRTIYNALNVKSKSYLQQHGSNIPGFLTANNITTTRSALLIPTVLSYSYGYTVLPASLVIVNLTLDYVDGAFARHEQELLKTSVDSSEMLRSTKWTRLNSSFGAYYDAIADKAFAVPIWLCMIQKNSDSMSLQLGLLSLCIVETYSSYVRTKGYYVQPSPFPVQNEAKIIDNPKVSATIVGKTKQALSQIGTALAILPFFQPLGTVLLWVSLPLAIASVVAKTNKVTVYCELQMQDGMDLQKMQLIEQARALGTELIVGLRSKEDGGFDEMVKMLQLNQSIDGVLLPSSLPATIGLNFLKEHQIQLVAVPAEATFVDEGKVYDLSLYDAGKMMPVQCRV